MPPNRIDGGPQGAARYALLNMPEPVAAADADFNRAITLAEFRQAALDRFQLLDKKHAGHADAWRSWKRCGRACLPAKPKNDAQEQHSRIGSPLPPASVISRSATRNDKRRLDAHVCLLLLDRSQPQPLRRSAASQPIAVTGHAWARLFISPMGEPFRRATADEDRLADWFAQADRNHDGMLTVDEMQRTPTASSPRSTPTTTARSIPTRSTHYERGHRVRTSRSVAHVAPTAEADAPREAVAAIAAAVRHDWSRRQVG